MTSASRAVRLLAAALVAVALSACATAPAPEPSSEVPVAAADRTRLNTRVFDRVWSLVNERYYDPRHHELDWAAERRRWRPRATAAADENALYYVLTGMLDALNDDHVYVQSPAEVRRERLGRARRPLFGVRVVRRGDGYVVDDVTPGGAADEAGVEVGWRVESADGRPYDVAATREAGRPVELTFRDASGARRVIRIAPRVDAPPPERRPLRRVGAAWTIAFDSFEPGTAEWLYGQLRALPAGAPLVVDLRDNVGGRIVEVERALGCFLPRGAPVAAMRTRRGRPLEAVVLGGCPARVTGPVAVLVGRRSRSGAEMFAAAVQEAGRGAVVGDRTAGALLSSLQHALPDGGRLTLSEADFLTARGNRIERYGLQPDVTASVTQADRRAGRDPGMTAAIAALAAPRASVAAAPEAVR